MRAPSNSQRCEIKRACEMSSEEECSGGCHEAGEDAAVCGSSAPLPTAASAPETADSCSLPEASTAYLNPQLSETTVCGAADEDSRRVGIESLPDEIFVKIFSHLSFRELVDVVQKVSSRWKRLSQDAQLWTNKEYEVRCTVYDYSDTPKHGQTDQEVIQAFCDAPNLRKIVMRRSAKSRVFRALYNNCHRLSELHLHHAQKLSYSVLKNLVEKCSQIHTLRIPPELLKNEKFSKAVSQLQHLRVLYLEVFLSEKRPVLRPLGDGCPQLAEVDFGEVTLDTNDLRHFLNAKRSTLKSIHTTWDVGRERCVLPLLTVCANSLERLQLIGFGFVGDEAEVREAFTALGSLKNLQELKLFLIHPPPLGTAALAFKTGGLPKLRLLHIRDRFGGFNDDTVIAAICGCPALRELSVRDAELLSDSAFSQIYRLQHLETLEVSCCLGLSGAFVPHLTGLPHLHTLRLERLRFPKPQPGLSSLLELSGLRSLSLCGSLITGVPFDKFPGKLVHLRELNISSCRGDPKVTEGLTDQMPGLEIIGYIEYEIPWVFESDAEVAEEENEENANNVQDGGSFHILPYTSQLGPSSYYVIILKWYKGVPDDHVDLPAVLTGATADLSISSPGGVKCVAYPDPLTEE